MDSRAFFVTGVTDNFDFDNGGRLFVLKTIFWLMVSKFSRK